MLKKELRWFFPEKPEEIPDILKKEAKVAFHGGGTSILRVKSDAITAMIDLSRLGWNKVRKDGSSVVIGATATFNEVVRSTASTSCSFRMLKDALSRAASNPIRNRITVGGSLADFPPWSDLVATLIALDARVTWLEDGKSEKKCSVAEFIDKKLGKEKNLVREIIVPEKELSFCVKRLARTSFEYGMFNLAVCGVMKDGAIESPVIVVTGTKDRVSRQTEAEAALAGKVLTDDVIRDAAGRVKVDFNADVNFGAEYKASMVGVYLRDALAEIAGRK